MQLARAHYALGEDQQAVSYFSKVLETASKDRDAIVGRARAYVHLRQLDLALLEYKRTISLELNKTEDQWADVCTRLGELQRATGDLKGAAHTYDLLLSVAPNKANSGPAALARSLNQAAIELTSLRSASLASLPSVVNLGIVQASKELELVPASPEDYPRPVDLKHFSPFKPTSIRHGISLINIVKNMRPFIGPYLIDPQWVLDSELAYGCFQWLEVELKQYPDVTLQVSPVFRAPTKELTQADRCFECDYGLLARIKLRGGQPRDVTADDKAQLPSLQNSIDAARNRLYGALEKLGCG